MYPALIIVGCVLWTGVRSEDLYVSTPTSIVHIDTSTLQTSTIITKANGRLLGLAADWRNQKLYYSDVSSNGAGIYTSDLTGNNARKLPIQYPDMEPVGLAVDWVYGHLYWTDSVYRSVMMSNLDGTGRITVVTQNLVIPRGIAVDPKRRELYIGDQGSHAVQICGLDGRNCRELNITDASATFWPNQITVDQVSQKVHWTDGWMPAIYTCTVGGTDCGRNTGNLTVDIGSNPVFGIAVGQRNDLYLSTLHNQSLYRSSASLELTSVQIPNSETQTFFLLNKDTTISQPTVSTTNPCALNKGGCSDLCIPHSGDSFTCACPDGSGKIPVSKTCQSSNKFLLFTDVSRGIVGMASIDDPEKQTTIIRAVKPLAVTYHLREKKVYFADARTRAIYKCNLDGSQLEAVQNSSHGIGQVEGLSIDYNQNRLYFSNVGFEEYSGVVRSWHAIEMLDLNTNKRHTVVTAVEKPRAVLVDSTKRVMYYTDWGSAGHVGRVQLDGSGREVLFAAEFPNDLAITDTKLLTINNKMSSPELIELDLSNNGINRRQLGDTTPLSLAVYGNNLLISSFDGGLGVYSQASLSRTKRSDVGQFTRMAAVDTTMAKLPDMGLCSSSSPCSEICVTLPDSSYFSCLCPSNAFNEQTSDRLSCQKPEDYLLFADIDGIKMVSQGTTGDNNVYTIIYPDPSCRHFYGLAVDRNQQFIYFSVLQGNTVFRAKVDGSNVEKFVTDENSKITSLALVGSDLFWTSTNRTDNSTGTIVHCDTAHSDRTITVIYSTAAEPLDIAADESNIYWTERGNAGVQRFDRRESALRSAVLRSSRISALALSVPSRHLLSATDSNVILRRFPTNNNDVSFLTDNINEADVQTLMATSKSLFLSRWRDNSTGSLTRHNLLTKTSDVITNAAVRPGQMVYISSQAFSVQDEFGTCSSVPSCSSFACSLDVDCYGTSKCCGTNTCTRCSSPAKGADCTKNGIYIQNFGDDVVVDCQRCSCQNSTLTCTDIFCPDLGDCPNENKIKPPGSCCSLCTATIICSTPPTIENCPTSAKSFLLPSKEDKISVSLYDLISESTYGKSCSGQKLDLHFTTTSLQWKSSLQPVTITATDRHGTATCTISVHIIDNTKPYFESCPNALLQAYITDSNRAVTWAPVVARDNSGYVEVTSNSRNGVDRNVGLLRIQYEARDGSGNMDQCSFSVNVSKLLGCKSPPLPFNGLLRCQDGTQLICELEKCNVDYIHTASQLQRHACDQTRAQWVPPFPSNFPNICIKPEPSIIQRQYYFEFNCPNSEFDAGDLKDCISNARLCPTNDITLCDRPFKRIGSTTVSASLFNISMRMDGMLPYRGNKVDLTNRMDSAGRAIEIFFQSGNFKSRCPQISCPFSKSSAATDVRKCDVGSVIFNVAGQEICAPCPAGWFDNENGECAECLPNTYQDRPGQTSCRVCPSGTISSTGSFLQSHCKLSEQSTSDPLSTDNMTMVIVGAVVGVIVIVAVVVVIFIFARRRSQEQQSKGIGNFENPAFTAHGDNVAPHPLVEEYDQIPADRVLPDSQIQKYNRGDSGHYESGINVSREDHAYQSLGGATNKGYKESDYTHVNDYEGLDKRLLPEDEDQDNGYSLVKKH